MEADHNTPTVGECAAHAEAACETFAEATGLGGEDIETRVKDLITDLLHLCDREGLDALGIVESAQEHWEEERDPALDS